MYVTITLKIEIVCSYNAYMVYKKKATKNKRKYVW